MGRVFLVGAGPSDAGLLTVKAKQVLETADVVVYDSLVGLSILAMMPRDAKKIDAGKRAGNHKLKQEETSRLLADLAEEYSCVVRLKGGDPFLFGRGGEEAEVLVERGIPFEVIPGVTSAICVPAYAGIPVTHRDHASMVHIITGHKKKDLPLSIDFNSLVQAGGTLVFLMGVSALMDIRDGLLFAGMSPDTPMAVLSKGTTAREQKLISTLGEIEKHRNEAWKLTPGIIVVGEVCGYEEELDWRKYQPLSKKRYLVTRPRERSMEISGKLRSYGGEVIELPTVRTRPLPAEPALLEAISHIKEYKLLMFTSPAGVTYFLDFLREKKIDIRALGEIKIAVIGTGTKKEFENRGIFCDYMPKEFYGKALGELASSLLTSGDKVLLPRAKDGNPQVTDALKEKNVIIDEIPIYETIFESFDGIDLADAIETGEVTDAIFTSASTVKGFMAAAGGADVTKIKAYCIGNLTAREAKEAGMHCFVAKEASIDSLVELALEKRTE